MTTVDALGDSAAETVGERPQVSVMLAKAREANGYTQKEVADQLYLTATFIRYIDEGQFQKIPKPAFIKGYLRSYARVVGLSGDEIIEAYDRELDLAPQAPAIGHLTKEAIGSGSLTGPVLQTGVFGLIAAALVVAVVWWLGTVETQPPVVTPAVDEVVDIDEVDIDAVDMDETVPGELPAVEAPIAAEAEEPDAISIEPQVLPGTVPEQAIPEQTTPVTPTTAIVEPAATVTDQIAVEDQMLPHIKAGVEIDRTRDGETQYITVYGGGESELEFAFTDDCWIRVKDGEGEMIYGDLNRAGDVMTIYGIAPFEVLVGKVPAVSMTYEGRLVDLSRLMTGDQTATVRTARL